MAAFQNYGELTEHLARAAAAAGQPVILWRYRSQDDLEWSRHAAGLPLGAYAMMIAWASDALGAEDIDVEIRWGRNGS